MIFSSGPGLYIRTEVSSVYMFSSENDLDLYSTFLHSGFIIAVCVFWRWSQMGLSFPQMISTEAFPDSLVFYIYFAILTGLFGVSFIKVGSHRYMYPHVNSLTWRSNACNTKSGLLALRLSPGKMLLKLQEWTANILFLTQDRI